MAGPAAPIVAAVQWRVRRPAALLSETVVEGGKAAAGGLGGSRPLAASSPYRDQRRNSTVVSETTRRAAPSPSRARPWSPLGRLSIAFGHGTASYTALPAA